MPPENKDKICLVNTEDDPKKGKNKKIMKITSEDDVNKIRNQKLVKMRLIEKERQHCGRFLK